ncbi:FAD-binding protein [Tepidiforma flava]|uniref:FAD-binding protein n=1 Tax=Tepidiforma flava TaxID=3004094 RepID=A0ABY7M3D8_9CHLR|nr:D-arabinono-1,4-lactone oxidase [Tepidiforma flava]WBL35120.1 FAD-binding protein [Tepidiforma flava]
MPTWTNWSGSVTATPRQLCSPASEEEVAAIVREAAASGRSVRAAGSGHSFVPVVPADDVILSLDALAGLLDADPASGRATLFAGTKLRDATRLLWERGLALPNQGDVDTQALAGAIATGTHGTGPAYGSISTRLAAARVVTADGALLDVDDPALLPAFRVSLGLLGIFTRITLACVPRYALRERVWQHPIDACLEELAANIAANDHYEFFWFPRSGIAESKSLNPVDEIPEREEPPPLDGPGERTGWSHRIYPSARDLRFNEMEYAVPAEAGPACFAAVRQRMVERHPKVGWPVEYRTLAADDAWLSPAFGRPTVTISVHQAAERPYREFFTDLEPIFRDFGGRPHWGKFHTCARADLAAMYPRFEAFCALRRQLDPAGRFLSPYLAPLFA